MESDDSGYVDDRGGTQNVDDLLPSSYDQEEEEHHGWCQLVSLNKAYPDQWIEDDKGTFVIGRNRDCDLQIMLPIVSGKHCRLERDGQTDLVFLYDTSTNGTFVNSEKIGRGNKTMLSNGDLVVVVQKQGSKQERVAFIYKYIQEDREEQEAGGPQQCYYMREVLGSGAFATVRLAVHKETGEKYAIKVIDKKRVGSKPKQQRALLDEVAILKRISHRNVIGIKEVFDTDAKMYIVLELVRGGELFDRIVKKKRLSEDEARPLMWQILEAVHYLHSQGIAHRDLKPENILLDDEDDEAEMVLKISDFGLSRIIGEGSFMATICGTPQYLAPEVLTKAKKGGYTFAVDIWSIGVIFYTMLAGYRPFEASGDMTIFEAIKKGKFSFPDRPWENISDNAKSLIKRMLTVDANERVSSEDALRDPWFSCMNQKRGRDSLEDEGEPKRVKESE